MRFEERDLRIEDVEAIWRETSDIQTSDDQTGNAACGVDSAYGGLYGGGRFLDCARNDRDKRDLRKEV